MRWVVGIAIAGLAAGCSEYDTSQVVSPGLLPGPDEVPEGSALETFEGGGQSTVDVIVVGDTSGSMDDELRTLGDTITRFVERLASQVDDWQLASVSDGSGCTSSGTLRPDTPDFAEKFADALVDPINDDSEAEMGLRNVLRVLEDADRACNDGLVRGGLLQVIFVTDENDESPGYDESPDYWREYLSGIQAAHGDASRVKLSAVAGPTPLGCRGADPGFGYDGPVTATGGKYLSICGDWANELDVIADAVGLRTTFPLSDEPVPGTIQVWINDSALPPAAFSHDPASNVVTISTPAAPSDTVSILYELAL
jgi:hypothetical protein